MAAIYDLCRKFIGFFQEENVSSPDDIKSLQEEIQGIEDLFQNMIFFPKVKNSNFQIQNIELIRQQLNMDIEKIDRIARLLPQGEEFMDLFEQKNSKLTYENCSPIRQWILDQNLLLTCKKLPIPKEIKKEIQKIPQIFNRASYLRKWLEENKNALKDTEELYLRNLDLTLIPPEIFTCFSALKVLDVAFNKLEEIPREIQKLTHLQELSVHNNRILSLPEELKVLSSLQELKVPNNEISFLPDELTQLTNLEVLDVEGNKLKALPIGLSKLPKLKSFKIAYNPISKDQ